MEVDLRYPEPRQRADERAAGRARGDTLKVAALFLTQHEGLERAARQLDGEVVDPLERDLAVDRQRRQELEQARREGAVVRAELEQLQLADPPLARLRSDELGDRERVQEALRLRLEDDLASDSVVEPLVDLGLGQRHWTVSLGGGEFRPVPRP